MSSADNLCKQFAPRSGPTEVGLDLDPNCLDTLVVFLKEFFEKVNYEKKFADDNKSMKNYPACKLLKSNQINSIEMSDLVKDITSQLRRIWSLLGRLHSLGYMHIFTTVFTACILKVWK